MKPVFLWTPQVSGPGSIRCAVTPLYPHSLADQHPRAPAARALCTQAHAGLVLSHFLEITRNAIQEGCFVSPRILKEALKDFYRNDLNKRTKKET